MLKFVYFSFSCGVVTDHNETERATRARPRADRVYTVRPLIQLCGAGRLESMERSAPHLRDAPPVAGVRLLDQPEAEELSRTSHTFIRESGHSHAVPS